MKKSYWVTLGVALLIVATVLGWFFYGAEEFLRRAEMEPAKPAPQVETSGPTSECPHTFISWNGGNFGKKKTDEDIALMAKILAHADIIALQEVTAGKNVGAQTVGRLVDALKRMGSDWDYVVSDPTEPPSLEVERYAYLIKKHVAAFDRDDAVLVKSLRNPIEREPYTLLFHPKTGMPFRIFTIHTVPTAKGPIREVSALVEAEEVKKADRAIVAGDFNLGPAKTDPLFTEIGYTGHIHELTSLRLKLKNGQYRKEQYDNIYTKGIKVCSSGVIDFVKNHFATGDKSVDQDALDRAHRDSDHLPVFITFR